MARARRSQSKRNVSIFLLDVSQIKWKFSPQNSCGFSEHAEKYAMRDLKGEHTHTHTHSRTGRCSHAHTHRISWSWLGLVSRRLSAHYQSDAAVFDMAPTNWQQLPAITMAVLSHKCFNIMSCVSVCVSVSECVCGTDPGRLCCHHLSTSSVSHENLLL